ncbi:MULTISPECIES: ABC transporter permease [unclassified Nocardiopsis]|uniref:ABC transporter permease n=1 Tax=unclassified Nocardiopsis TaxID=2649073 RepID=UPI0013580C41|nr:MULTISPECIES: ABC transporter permease [unclassified Nocardiopsis]
MSTGTGRRPLTPALNRLVVTEARLLLREPLSVGLGMLLPTAILLGIGAIPVTREPSPEFGGLRFVEIWAPTALVLGMGILCVQHLPSVLATYRENGVLRRMSTTPVHPGMVLAAQLAVVFAATVASGLLLVLSAWLVLDVEPPRQPLLFAAAFLVGSASLIALGTLVAAVAPSASASNGMSMVLYMFLMLVGGVFLPRVFLPDVLVRMGEFTPPGVQLLLESWSGTADASGLSQLVQLAIMAGVAVAAAVLAARLFRWE